MQLKRGYNDMIRIIDLSHTLVPGKQRFRLDMKTFPVKEYVPGYPVAEDQWYVMQELYLCTHVGTHVEAPYHAIEKGIGAGELDLRRLVGPAAVIDFLDKGYNDPITEDEMIQRGSHVQNGDIVLIRTGLSEYYGTPKYKRPYLVTDAVEWLIERGMKCLGIDCSGIENKQINSEQINHRTLFSNNIPLIEDMNNLVKLQTNRVFFMAFPIPIKGLDASPLRPIAVEPLYACEGFIHSFLHNASEFFT
jgi:arylformamidase